MAFTRFGSICDGCFSRHISKPPFDIPEDEYQAKRLLYSTVGSIFDGGPTQPAADGGQVNG